MNTLHFSRTLFFSLLFCILPATSFAASAQASIKIDQLSAGATGVWTMLSSVGTVRTSNDDGVDARNYTIGISDYGQTVLSVVPPAGMSVRIVVFRGGEQIAESDSQQYSFNVRANDNYRFVLQYALTKLGSLGVTSDPARTRFRMRGPTRRVYSGRTAHTFTNLPAGKYTLIFPAVKGCTAPTIKNAVIETGTRNTVHVSLSSCELSEEDESLDYSRISKRTLRDMVLEREQKPRGERK